MEGPDLAVLSITAAGTLTMGVVSVLLYFSQRQFSRWTERHQTSQAYPSPVVFSVKQETESQIVIEIENPSEKPLNVYALLITGVFWYAERLSPPKRVRGYDTVPFSITITKRFPAAVTHLATLHVYYSGGGHYGSKSIPLFL